MSVTVYGASDDLIEVEGDIREEFYAGLSTERDGQYLAFSEGTVLKIRYSDSGVWRVVPVVDGVASLKIEQAPEDDDGNYSDRANLSGPVIRWVVLGHSIALGGGS